MIKWHDIAEGAAPFVNMLGVTCMLLIAITLIW